MIITVWTGQRGPRFGEPGREVVWSEILDGSDYLVRARWRVNRAPVTLWSQRIHYPR